MIQFILNEQLVRTNLSPGITLLDFIRYEQKLTGTKIGCREGDCGACTVLVGELAGSEIIYKSVTSCLMPLANAQGRHIVSIEGINFKELNPIQQAMSDEGATQCGFCTPGFVMSLAGFCMQDKSKDPIAAIDGNICRCTGYKSIERAAERINALLSERGDSDPVKFACEKKIIPGYFTKIKNRLSEIGQNHSGNDEAKAGIFVGGGTDLYVQKHEEMTHERSSYLSGMQSMKGIELKDGQCVIGASSTVTDLLMSPVINKIFPSFPKYAKLVSSTPIRNMATIGGNFVNASPIGDFTVFFLALNSAISLSNGRSSRTIALRDFYKGYKKLDKTPEEYVESLSFRVPDKSSLFNFEKVSKRTHLDIASVNTGLQLEMDGDVITRACLSAGGVGPVPMYLRNASEYLKGRRPDAVLVNEACTIAGDEISPISDARGSATYKRFLLQQLIRAHFMVMFPDRFSATFESTYEKY